MQDAPSSSIYQREEFPSLKKRDWGRFRGVRLVNYGLLSNKKITRFPTTAFCWIIPEMPLLLLYRGGLLPFHISGKNGRFVIF